MCDLLSLSGKFQLGRIARDAGFTKEKGVPCKFLLLYLLLVRICKDSWYDGLDFIREIRKVGNGSLHILCMAKNGNRKYKDGDQFHTIKQMDCLERASRQTT